MWQTKQILLGWCRMGPWRSGRAYSRVFGAATAKGSEHVRVMRRQDPHHISSLSIFKTAYHVVVHHAGRLHMRVADRGADELEAALLQVLGQGVGLRRRRPHGFSSHPIGVAQRPVAREAPDVPVEAAKLFLDLQEASRVGDGRFDLQAIPDDTLISHQACNVRLAESRHFPSIEVLERLPEVVALAQDDNPAQPRLEALQGQHLEDLPIVMDRHAPFLVVILTVQRILSAPPAPRLLRTDTFQASRPIESTSFLYPCLIIRKRLARLSTLCRF